MTDPTPNTTPWNSTDWEEEPEAQKLNPPIVPCWMTRREYFAALAMSGLLAGDTDTTSAIDIADFAVDQADKLIAALEN